MKPEEIDEHGVQSFLILGAAKCATTSLYRYMIQHPDVLLSTPKEPIFFEAEYERGLAFYRSKYFREWAGERVVGEARAHNLALPFVPQRVRELLPNAKLIAVVRDPVDRLYSEWWHRTTRRLEPEALSEAIRTNLARIANGSPFEGEGEGESEAGAAEWAKILRNRHSTGTRYGLYLELGYYAQQLHRYLALFPADQLEVVLYDDLLRDTESVVRGLWSFIGVDANAPLDVAERHNVALDVLRHPLALHARRLRPGVLRRIVGSPLIMKLRPLLRGRPASKPPMDSEAERFLLDHYAPHNRDLEELLGRPLPGWFEPKPERTRAVDEAPG